MAVVTWILFMTSLQFTWQIAVARQHIFDEERISLITAIEDAFCEHTLGSDEGLSGSVHEVGTTEGFNSIQTGINYSLPVAPPRTPAVGCCSRTECKLHLDCVQTDSCCVQMFGKVPDVTTKLVCMQPQLRPPSYYYINVDSYLMLKGCSASENEMLLTDTARLMCENPEDFDSLDVKVPVTDIELGVTFINRYCAFCNGKTDRDIEYWQPEVICESGSLGTAEDVVVEISKTVSCNLIFKKPSSAAGAKLCDAHISSCNVTGHWTNYDSLIEQACVAYTAPYINKYKNVFCFLCNTDRDVGYDYAECKPNANTPNPDGPQHSFSAILRFRPKEDKSPLKKLKCTESQMYDGYKGICRNITCYPPRTYQQGKCVSPFQTVSGVFYRFYIRLTPNETLNQDDIEANSIIDSLLRWMENTTVPQAFVSIRLFLKPNAQSHNNQSTTDYYLAQVGVYIPVGENVQMSFIEDIFSLENETVSVPDYTDFYPLFVVAELSKVDRLASNLTEENEQYLLMFDSIHGDMLLQLNGENGLDNSGFVEHNGVFIQLPPLEVMTPAKVCPLVQLSTSEFEMERFTWGFSINAVEKNISKARYIEIPDKTRQNNTIFVCKSLFEDIVRALMLKYPQKTKSGKSDVPQGMLSLVCTCLSVFCSLLTLTTYVLFKELRTQPGINNIMLTISLICAQILFQFGASQAENVTELGCKILGVLVHFTWLMTVMWMNVCSLHMFRVFKSLRQRATGTSIVKTTFVYTGYCSFVSTIPVAATIAASLTKYGEFGYGGNICYISHYDMVGYTFALPVGVIIFTNCSLFFSVIIMITKLPKLDGRSTKNRNFAKIYIKLSTLTGLTWLFGFVFAFTGIEALEYIFIVLNAGVGVFIFLAFVCNKRVLKLYTIRLRSRKIEYSESSKQSSVGDSTRRERSSRCNEEAQS